MYHQYDVQDSSLWFFRVHFLSNDGNFFIEQSAMVVSAGYALLAALFSMCAMYLVFGSIQSRGLFVGGQPTTRKKRCTLPSTTMMSFTWWRTLKRKLRIAKDLVSVQGPYFATRLLLDDIVELFSQTAVAYAASHRVSNVALNLTYGIVIFLTSIVPSVSKLVFRHSRARRRMACLIADLILEFVWGSVLPIWMAYPARQIYWNRDSNGEQLNDYSDPAREIESILVLSWLSFALSVVPFVSMLLNLVEIQSILEQARPSPPSLAAMHRSTTVLTLTYSAPPPQGRQHVLLRGLHKVMPVYGLAVLVTTILASHVFDFNQPNDTNPQRFDCIHRVFPWFTVDEACAGRRINCSSAGIQGRSHEIDAVFTAFNAQALRDLFIIDCAQLTMPPSLGRFSGLETLTVVKSRIIEWNHDAALVDAVLPELRAMKLIEVNFNETLTGLVTQPLASKMDWILLAHVPNASLLLDFVGDHWQHLHFFNCVGCRLTTFPEALKTMRHIAMIHLAFNDIAQIPDDWNVDPSNVQLDALWIDVNPRLTTLPDSLWRQAARDEIVSMEYTGLTIIPTWLPDVVADVAFQIFAAGTPVCSQQPTISIHPLVKCDAVYIRGP